MKFVLNPEEVKEMLQILKPVFVNLYGLIAVIETTPEFIKEILPPPLEPAELPYAKIAMQTGKAFNGFTAYVSCRYGDIEGDYGIGFVMDTDYAVTFGRELFGEPKKQGDISLTRNGNDIVGTVRRKGVEIARMEAKALQPADPNMISEADNFHFKYAFKADGSGIEDARLVHAHFNYNIRSIEACEVKIKLQDSVHDIYGNIPIKNILGCVYVDFDLSGQGRYLTEVDPEILLPYAFFKHDDYRVLRKESSIK